MATTRIYTDPSTGVYEDSNNNWFLSDGTPISDYDPKTGAYQEADNQTWYTFQGVELMNYDMSLGAYQEESGIWYNTSGQEVLMGSPLYLQIQAYGYDVSNNTTPQGSQGKVSPNTINTTTATNKTAVKSNSTMVILGIVGIVVVVGIMYFALRKK